jgi:hypothetical protein
VATGASHETGLIGAIADMPTGYVVVEAFVCSTTSVSTAASKPVPIVAAAGDRLLLIANGLTEADRSMMVLKV